VVLRFYLVWQGGQYYWPDERLYRASQTAAGHILSGDFPSALRTLHGAEHFLFKIVGLLPAFAEHAIGANSRIPGLFFALFSVASVLAVHQIALLLGASSSEALLTAFLLVCSTTWLYYSRHLLAYDAAMTVGLCALAVALRRPAEPRRWWSCGLLCSAAFLTYSGYWTLAVFVMLVAVTWRSSGVIESLVRAGHVGAAFATPLVALLGASTVFGGNLVDQFGSAASAITQGRFEEGWRLPLAYFWHAEHALAVVWLCSVIFAARFLPSRNDRSRLPLLAVGFIYALLVVTSVALDAFVVYGRLARQLVPFLCLLTARQLHDFFSLARMPKHAPVLVCALIAIQAAANMWVPLRQIFPGEFRAQAREIMSAQNGRRFELLFADHIYPQPDAVDLSSHTVLARAPHPLQFLPYQYEGYTPEERARLRATDISMRLVTRQ